LIPGAKNPQEINVAFFHILNRDYSIKGSSFAGLYNGGDQILGSTSASSDGSRSSLIYLPAARNSLNFWGGSGLLKHKTREARRIQILGEGKMLLHIGNRPDGHPAGR